MNKIIDENIIYHADEQLTEFEVAKLLRVSVYTLRSWRFKKIHLPYSKTGRVVRYRYGDIITHQQKNKISVT